MSTRSANIRLPLDVYDRINALARRNDRSVGAEIRIAIREHLAMHVLYANTTTAMNLDAGALPISEHCKRVSSRLAGGQGNAAEDGE